jgi:hypothetical protein
LEGVPGAVNDLLIFSMVEDPAAVLAQYTYVESMAMPTDPEVVARVTGWHWQFTHVPP